jgi:hypothetical protein
VIVVTAALIAAVKYRDGRHAALIVALGVTAFLLGNKGFSPQFVTWLVPVILLVFPNRQGVIYVVLLTICMAAYYAFVLPVMKAYFLLGIVPIEEVVVRVWPYVTLRTLLLVVLTIHLFKRVIRPAWNEPTVQVAPEFAPLSEAQRLEGGQGG